MRAWDDMNDVQPLSLDGETAERLLAGRVAPKDAPPGYGPVVCLLEAAAAVAGTGAMARESETVAAFAWAVRSSRSAGSRRQRRSLVPVGLNRARLVAVAIAAALATTTGLATAGALPGPVQDMAARILDKLGVSIPGSDEAAALSGSRGWSHVAFGADVAGAGKLSGVAGRLAVMRVDHRPVRPSAARIGPRQTIPVGPTDPVAGAQDQPETAPNVAAETDDEVSDVGPRAQPKDAVQRGPVAPQPESKSPGQAGRDGPPKAPADTARRVVPVRPSNQGDRAHGRREASGPPTSGEPGREPGGASGSTPPGGDGNGQPTRPDDRGREPPEPPGGGPGPNAPPGGSGPGGGNDPGGSPNDAPRPPRRP